MCLFALCFQQICDVCFAANKRFFVFTLDRFAEWGNWAENVIARYNSIISSIFSFIVRLYLFLFHNKFAFTYLCAHFDNKK